MSLCQIILFQITTQFHLLSEYVKRSATLPHCRLILGPGTDLDEVTLVEGSVSAVHELRALLLADVDVAHDLFKLVSVDLRALFKSENHKMRKY